MGTVGNNAPFVGLLGTVIGVVGAFDALGKPAAERVSRKAVQFDVCFSAFAIGLPRKAFTLAAASPGSLASASMNFRRAWLQQLARTYLFFFESES